MNNFEVPKSAPSDESFDRESPMPDINELRKMLTRPMKSYFKYEDRFQPWDMRKIDLQKIYEAIREWPHVGEALGVRPEVVFQQMKDAAIKNGEWCLERARRFLDTPPQGNEPYRLQILLMNIKKVVIPPPGYDLGMNITYEMIGTTSEELALLRAVLEKATGQNYEPMFGMW